MPPIIEGSLDAKGLKFALVASRFNEFVTAKLVESDDAARREGGDTRWSVAMQSPVVGFAVDEEYC